MLVKFTITLTAESRQELIDMFPSECKQFKQVFESITEKGAWGPAEKVRLGFIFNSGMWSTEDPQS